MNLYNSLVLEGIVTKSCELECQFKGVKQHQFTVEVTRQYESSRGNTMTEKSEFEAVAYGALAEFNAAHAKVGQSIRVVGRLKQIKWTDGDGKKQSAIKIIAEHIEYKPMFENKEAQNGTERSF